MRMPTRAALSMYAGPTPLPVVPMRRAPSLASDARSSAGWYGMIRCALREMKRLPSSVMPRRTRPSISSMTDFGSSTTPQPITQRQFSCRIPDGIECRTYFSRPTTTVWPALLPPLYRTTTSTCGPMMSTTLPLPSSPHCVPTTTMLGMLRTSRVFEVPIGRRENLSHDERALAAPDEVHRQQLTGVGSRTADDEDVPRALGARVRDRLVEPAGNDVPGDRRAQVPEAPGQRQRRRLLRGEIDDEEIRAGHVDDDPLRLHDGERAADVEREADRRAVVAEAADHRVVAAAAGDRGAEVGHVRFEVQPGIVVEATHLAEIEQHGVGESVDAQQPMHLGEVHQRALRSGVAREWRGALEHAGLAEQGREREQRVRDVGGRRQLGHEPLE